MSQAYVAPGIPFDQSDVIAPLGRDYLTPGEVAHVARTAVQTGVGPLYEQMNYLVVAMRRLMGDSSENDLPQELRSKGLISDIIAKQDEHTKQNNDVVELLADLNKRVCAVEGKVYRMRRGLVWFRRVLGKKDDGFSVAIGKLLVFNAALSGLVFGAVKAVPMTYHKLLKLIVYLDGR